MVDRKSVLMIAIAFALTTTTFVACGSANNPEDLTPRDAKTGKTYKNTNEMLTQVKEQRPFEYDIVYEMTKDNPDAMKSYENYNATTADVFDAPSFIDKEGSSISKDDFGKILESMKFKGDFENSITFYFQNLEKGFYKEAFDLIMSNSPFSQIFGNRFEVYKNAQEQSKAIVRVTDVLPSEYKIIDQGGIVYLQVTFRLTGFWTRQVLESAPDNFLNNMEKKKVETPTQPKEGQIPNVARNTPKMDWQYNASGKTIFRLANVNGKWLIYAQI